MNNTGIYYMEKDGAVEIPDKYKKMSHNEISAECARLAKEMKEKAKISVKKTKAVSKTKFVL